LNTRSLKFRLVVWYAGWLAILLVSFGGFSYVTLDYHLNKDMREALARRARQVAEAARRSPNDWQQLGKTIHETFAPEANSRLTRVTIDDSVAYLSGDPVDGSFHPKLVPPASVQSDHESFARRSLQDGTMLFVVTLGRSVDGKHFTIEEGSSTQSIDTVLQERLIALVFGLTFLVIVAVLGGFALVQRALAPVDKIIKSAEQISSRNLSEHLPVPATGDELERMSVSLNGMIRRLDEAFEQTRRFVADASHELRTPLTILHGELEEMVKQNSQNPELQNLAGSALEEVNRLKKTVEALFALSRLDAGEAQQEVLPVDLGELVTTTTDQMCLLAEDKKILIDCRCSHAVMVQGDRARLKQVVVNLLDNALKYTPPGGRIDVSVTAHDRQARLQVADNGIGIPNAALSHVFDRFYRADKARSREMGGAGLGLAIVKAICLAHNGRVHVESEEGAGSRFTVELPFFIQSGKT
jgi:heavy metal sensor kinase